MLRTAFRVGWSGRRVRVRRRSTLGLSLGWPTRRRGDAEPFLGECVSRGGRGGRGGRRRHALILSAAKDLLLPFEKRTADPSLRSA